jgi:hypothetical protein
MDTLQSLLSAQAPMLDYGDLPDGTAFAPAAHPLDDEERWTGDLGEVTDRAIFAELVTGG